MTEEAEVCGDVLGVSDPMAPTLARTSLNEEEYELASPPIGAGLAISLPTGFDAGTRIGSLLVGSSQVEGAGGDLKKLE